MTDTSDGEDWSARTASWVEHWACLSQPARRCLADLTGIGAGMRFLDIGCGTGELAQLAAWRGAEVSGIDAALGMLNVARHRLPRADLRHGDLAELPWEDATFDVVTALNAFQFAGDTDRAYAEAARVVRPGGLVAVCQWSASGPNEIRAVLGGFELPDDAFEPRLRAVGLTPVGAGEVETPWVAPDEATLVRACAHQTDHPDLLERAAPYRRADGGYRFENRFRYALARA